MQNGDPDWKAQIMDTTAPRTSNVATLNPALGIFDVCLKCYDKWYDPTWDVYGRAEWPSEFAQNIKLWFYESNAQGAPYPTYATNTLLGMEPRVMHWGTWYELASGFLMWSVNTWDTNNPWGPNTLYGKTGDGVLLYPGNHDGVLAPAGSPPGVAIDGPVPSYRLKMIRAGLQDWALFKLADQHGLTSYARAQVVQAYSQLGGCDWSGCAPMNGQFYWKSDDSLMMQIRRNVAQAILGTSQATPSPTVVGVSSATPTASSTTTPAAQTPTRTRTPSPILTRTWTVASTPQSATPTLTGTVSPTRPPTGTSTRATGSSSTPTQTPTLVATTRVTPVPGHPRLWITASDLPRLRSWAVPTNPIYQQGLLPQLTQSISVYDNQFFPAAVPNPTYPDYGDTQGYTGQLSEEQALIFAFHSLIDPDPNARINYAQRARNLLMYAMQQAALGHLAGAPFRDSLFAVYNRANATGQDWPLIVDWIYTATDAAGNPILTAQDKLTIRNVFVQWANDCLNASTTGGDHPAPIGVMNSPQPLPGNQAYRMAANNYYLGHARLLTMMALSLDAGDDPPINGSQPVTQLGNSLRSYLADATGAWLYQVFAMFADAPSVAAAYGLPGTAGLGLASGGLPPEGMLYGHSFAYIFDTLLALETAGYDDRSLSGPQIGLIGAPVWDRFVRGFIASLVPAAQVFASEPWLGPAYQMGSYGDLLRLYITPDFMQPFALLALLDQRTGVASRLNAERWFMINATEGGTASLFSRVLHPWNDVESILYFLVLDPALAPPTDPRPSMALDFYDAPQGRLVGHSDWSPSGSMFDFRCSWLSINHQDADAGQFELYRNGEWLTKEVSNYDNSGNGQSSVYHNTLTLQNSCQNGTPANLNWWEPPFWDNGSQWPLGTNAGDPTTFASTSSTYDFAYCDATNLYNRPSVWTPANAALDILHASRSIVWLRPDRIVVYDRARSQSTGRFKRFNLAFVNAPTIVANQVAETTPNGQHLYVTTLLPANPTISVTAIGTAISTIAELEPSQYRAVIEDPSNPTSVRFLHVLQGADANVAADTTALGHSTAGTPFDGAIVNTTAVWFPVDVAVPFAGVTYSLPSTVTQQIITGLTPSSAYDVVVQPAGGTVQVTIAPGSTVQTDSAGVLAWPPGSPSATATPSHAAAPQPTITPTPTWTPTRSPTLMATVIITATSTPAATSTPTPMPAYKAAGQVRYHISGLPVEAVEVDMYGATSEFVVTDASGAFAFTGLGETNWTLEPQKHGSGGTGISVLDAAYVLQAVVGSRQLDFEQQLACDTSGNGTLSVLDAAFILQYVVGLIPSLPVAQVCGSDWAFVPVPAETVNQRLIQPVVGAGTCQHGAIALGPLASDANNQNFSAVLFGDCAGDWQPSTSGTGAAFVSQSPGAATVRLGVVHRGRGGRIRFPLLVESAEPFRALDSRVSYDPTTLRVVAARLVNAARNSLIEYNANVPGMVAIAVASAEPITTDGGTVLVLDFERRRSGWLAPPHVLTASVDGRSAAVIARD